MAKYMMNSDFGGYDQISIDDTSKINKLTSDDTIFLVVDDNIDNSIAKYYSPVSSLLRSGVKVILINNLESENKAFKVLASLLVNWNDYNIYEVAGNEVITDEYLIKLDNRHPDYGEIQTYIGGDVSATSNMGQILFGIESLVEEGDIDRLKSYVEENMQSISSMTAAIDAMKKECAISNSGELVKDIEALKVNTEKLEKSVSDKQKEIETIKGDKERLGLDNTKLKADISKLKTDLADIKESATSGGTNVIRSFVTTQLQSVRNMKVKRVLYFKEISYVRYANTLVSVLTKILEMASNRNSNLRYKTIIYDNSSSDMYAKYGNLRVVDGQTFVQDKETIVKRCPMFVVSEPANNIIESIITADPGIDVLIIYDRMYTQNDIVSGNLVTKYYIANSSSDIELLKTKLSITNESSIITNMDNRLISDLKNNKGYLYIPEVQGITQLSRANNNKSAEYVNEGITSAIIKPYMRLTLVDGRKLINEILDNSLINQFINGSQA